MTTMVVLGDAMLDRDQDGVVERVCPDAPAPVVDLIGERMRPGGAGLAAILAAQSGIDTTLVTALGRDEAGHQVRTMLGEQGIEVIDLGLEGCTPEKSRVRAAGTVLMRLDRGATSPTDAIGPVTPATIAALRDADAIVVSDYGGGLAAAEGIRAALSRVVTTHPLVWDPHPRGREPVPGSWLATPNEREAFRAAGLSPARADLASTARAARHLLDRWGVRGVSVTRGDKGALLAMGGDGPPLAIPAPVASGDPCGAGDCFATSTARALADGALLSEAVFAGVTAASAFVGCGGASNVGTTETERSSDRASADDGDPNDAAGVVARVRRSGGAVVTTGGCFDLLHAGHVDLLHHARALGDCLVVCLNSDASVSRLKGPGRPVVPATDRARVLLALQCVDAVVVFEEDTPVRTLRRIKPDLFVKGGDYASTPIPEQDELARWGGQVVTVPYLDGHSTTRLIQEASRERS